MNRRTWIKNGAALAAGLVALLCAGLGLTLAEAQSADPSAEQTVGKAAEHSAEHPMESAGTPTWASANDAASPSFIPETTTFSASRMLMRVGLGLVLVLGILGSVLFLYKKASRGSLGVNSRNGIELLTQRSLGQRSSLAVVRVSGETMLLGITAAQINMLTHIGQQPAAREVEPLAAPIPESKTLRERPPAPAGADLVRENPFETTLAGEVRRVRENLVTSLRRLDLDR